MTEPVSVSSPYAAAVLAQAPRVLGLMDRDAMSRTAGCLDRTYWAWKFVDFPATRMQEGICALAFLYATPLADSPYYRHRALMEWIEMALGFWSRLQHADGSFDEAYPFERSLAATAFSTFYVGEALELVADDLSSETLQRTRETMAGAGRWLSVNDETHGFLSNHLAAAAAALLHVGRQTQESSCHDRCEYFLGRILARQSDEGWYDEYGGADPGYQTHGSFYLARIWQLTRDERLAASLGRAARFLAHFIHPDGGIGGEYASRNTQTYYPAACEMLADTDAASAWMAQVMRPRIGTAAAATLGGIDIFNFYPFLNNFVFAHRAMTARPAPSTLPDPTPEQGMTWFPKAGLARVRTSTYDAFVGAAKGGVIKVFDRRTRQLTYSDCGYVGRLDSGQTVSTQYHDTDRPMAATAGSIEVEGTLVEFSRPTMTPVMFLGFRGFTLTLGRLPGLARWLKTRLVKTLIYRRRALRVRFTRRLEFSDAGVRIIDRLVGPDGGRVTELKWGSRFTTIHMGSSRYFVSSELSGAPSGEPVDHRRLETGLEREHAVPVAE